MATNMVSGVPVACLLLEVLADRLGPDPAPVNRVYWLIASDTAWCASHAAELLDPLSGRI